MLTRSRSALLLLFVCYAQSATHQCKCGTAVQSCLPFLSAGDTIQFSPNCQYQIISELSITLDGVVLRGGTGTVFVCTALCLAIDLASVTLSGITFVNGHGSSGFRPGYGGCVSASLSTVIIEGCAFSNCQATYGGALALSWSNATITSSTFSSNTATAAGGAIYVSRGSTSLYNTTGEANSVYATGITLLSHPPAGGFLFLSEASLLLTATHVHNNRLFASGVFTQLYGGAVAAASVTRLRVSVCDFANNTVHGEYVSPLGGGGDVTAGGGALGVLQSDASFALDVFELTDSVFENNGVSGSLSVGGGAIALAVETLAVLSASITRTTLRGNSANCSLPSCVASGGAVLLSGVVGGATLSECSLADNVAASVTKAEGGAVAFVLTPCVLVGSTFTHNAAVCVDPQCGTAYAGAVALGGAALQASNSTFVANFAVALGVSSGGAIGAFVCAVTVNTSSFINNEVLCTFPGCYANGGAATLTLVVSNIDESTFEGNRAASASCAASLAGAVSGGAMYIADGRVNITSSLITNSAVGVACGSGAGGAVNVLNASVILVDTVVNGSSVTCVDSPACVGGGFSFAGSQATIVNSSFSGCSVHCLSDKCAVLVGGAVASLSNAVKLTDTLQPSTKILNCTFTNNTVTSTSSSTEAFGGGVYLFSASLVIGTLLQNNCVCKNCTMETCTSSISGLGGGLYLSTNQAADPLQETVVFTVIECVFRNNAAGQGSQLYSITSTVLVDCAMEGVGVLSFIFDVLNQNETDASRYACSQMGTWLSQATVTVSSPLAQPVDAGHSYVFDITSIVTQTFTCLLCQPGLYGTIKGNSTIDSSSLACHTCPFGGDCSYGGSDIQAFPNFWGLVNGESGLVEFTACPVGYCCQTGSCEYSYCEGNRTGVLCGGCQQGYGTRFFTQSCGLDSECTNTQWVTILAMLIVAFVYAAAMLVRAESGAGLIQILFFFYQTTGIIGNTIQWQTFESSVIIVTVLQSLASLAPSGTSATVGMCLLPGMTAITKTAAGFFVPTLLLATLVLLSLLLSRLSWPWPPQELRWRVGCAAVTTMVLAYQSLLLSSLQLLQCVEVGGEMRLFLDGDVACGQPWQIAPIAVLLLILPFPLVLLWLSNRGWGDHVSSKAILKKLASPFRPSMWWWQAAFLYRRLVLTLLYTFISNTYWRQFGLTLASLAILASNTLLRPFERTMLHVFETSSLSLLVLVCIITLRSATETSIAVDDGTSTTGTVLVWLQLAINLIPASALLLYTLYASALWVCHRCFSRFSRDRLHLDDRFFSLNDSNE